MNRRKICVVGGDARMAFAAQALRKKGYTVAAAAAASDVDVLVLPVRGCEVPRAVLEEVLAKGGIVIGGMLPVKGERCYDYMEDEAFLYDNARITAEGAVVMLGQALSGTLYDADIGILGMGRIAECLCMMLKGMGARVTVYARRPEALARARAMGAQAACLFEALPKQMTRHDALCNTVPHVLLDAALLSQVSKDTVLLELASAPGGFDEAAAEKYGLRMIEGRGIPGKYAPRAAGELIACYTAGVLDGEVKA